MVWTYRAAGKGILPDTQPVITNQLGINRMAYKSDPNLLQDRSHSEIAQREDLGSTILSYLRIK